MALCSLAIVAGVLGVAMVARKVAFYRRFGGHGGPWAYAGCGPGFGHHGARRWGGHGPGRSFWLRRLFARLDTTPGQEREIRAAIEDFQTSARGAKDGVKEARNDVARAIRSESFDDGALADAGARVDGATSHVREAFASALKRVHAVLDDRQRERLAELLEKGPPFARGPRHPYRD
jgi:uncharacterized membrane protein